MKTKSNLLLLILFAFTIGIVSWFGFQLVQQQSQQIKLSQINSSEQALVLMQKNINDYVLEYSNNLYKLLNQELASLENSIDNNPAIHELVLFDKSEQLIYSSNESLEKQQHGLQWLASIPDPSESKTSVTNKKGWFTWYDGQREKFIYWAQNPSRSLFVELNNSMFKADLIYWLSTQPDITQQVRNKSLSSSTNGKEDCCLLQITDNLNRIFYQWGDSKVDESSVINIQKNLSNPLSGWSLRYYAKLKSLSSLSKILFQIVIFGILVLMSIIIFMIFKIRKKEQLEAQQKLSFINQVSHELKTPLTNIRLHGDLLERSIDDVNMKQSSIQSLAIIQQESQRLTRLINNVLNFNSVEKQSLTLQYSNVDFEELLLEATLPFQPRFESLNIKVIINNQVSDSVRVDVDIIKQIIGNLLSNVEKYASDTNEVHLEACKKNSSNKIRIVFKDQGAGIKSKFSEKIFQPFYRVDSSLKTAAGSGLGLALARDLARLHGGELELVPSDKGACFELTIEVGNA
jgi:signal transduction histidine kinase